MLQGNKHEVVNDFLSQSPELSSFIEKVEYFRGIANELMTTDSMTPVGCLLVDTAPVLRVLSQEANRWAVHFSYGLSSWISEQVVVLNEFFEISQSEIVKPVNNLDQLLSTVSAGAITTSLVP